MSQSLKERQSSYEEIVNYKLMPRVPVIIRLDARSFAKNSRHCEKPFDESIHRMFCDTMLSLVKSIDGAVFGYHNNDEINIITKNDQSLNTDPWMGNHIQKITSVVASMATLEFKKCLESSSNPPDIKDPVIFEAFAWTVPNHIEVVNYLVFRQNECLQVAITDATYYEVLKRFSKKEAGNVLNKTSIADRERLLSELCDIDFFSYYPNSFKLGTSAFIAPKVYEGSNITKHKWILESDLNRFVDDYDFLYQIISTGSDIFRRNRDLIG